MSEILNSADLRIAIVGAAFGTFSTLLIQFLVYRYRLFMSFKCFVRDLDNLDRHVTASIKSLTISESSPRYLIAARMRFCKFMDGMRSIDQLEWLTQRRDSDKILPTLLAIRNSDTFMEELATRVDDMSEAQLAAALEDGRLNMRFLHQAILKLGYGTEERAAKMSGVPTKEILDEISNENQPLAPQTKQTPE